MSRLEELIEELCPNGVERLNLGEVLKYEQPTKYIVKDTNYSNDFLIPVLTAGDSFILGYTNEKDNIFEADISNPVIIFDDFTTSFKWVDFNFKVKSSAMKILMSVDSKKFILRYIFFCMGCIKYTCMQHSRQWIQNYSKIKIPIPPLEIQEEIVKRLDKFTELTKVLTKELTLRKKQYEYYRDKLLKKSSNIDSVELRCIVDKYCTGATPLKSNMEYYKNGKIPWLQTQNVYFNEIYKVDKYITEEAVEKTGVKWIPENCVIVALSGASAGRCAVNKIRITTNQHCFNMKIDKSKALYKYVFYCISSKYRELTLKKQGTRGDLNSSLILGLKIPLPSIEEQERIVRILDRFDKLCNDISEGLPAEIEAREKQYEYYREKLLTFKELEK